MFVSILERQTAILEDGCHHKVVWQRYCRKSLIFMLAGICVNLAPFKGNDRD